MENPQTVREFWFGSNVDDAIVAQERSSLWWSKSTTVDHEMRGRFGKLVLAGNKSIST